MKSILVMQLFRHDAVLQSTPALAALRANFPSARIHALVCKPYGDVLRGNPDVDEVIEWDIDSLDVESADEEATVERLAELKESLRPIREGRSFDVVCNLSATALSALVAYLLSPRDTAGLVFCRDRNYRVRNEWLRYLFAGGPAGGARLLKVFNRADVFARACGGQEARHPLRIAVTPADERFAAEALDRHFRDPAMRPIGFHTGAHRDCALWPGKNFAQFAGALRRAGHGLVFFGGADERAEIAEVLHSPSCGDCGERMVNLAGNVSFGQLAALLKRCQLLISNNPAAANVAAAAGTPCLMVAPLARDDASGWERGPYGEGHFVLEPAPPCSGGRCFSARAVRQRDEPLTPEVVLAATACALSDGREIPGLLRNSGAVLRRSCWMPDGLWGLEPLTRPELTLKELLRLMLRSCLRQRRLAKSRGEDGSAWRPWLKEVFAWYSLDDRGALLRDAARAAESFAMLHRMAALGIGTANVAVMQSMCAPTKGPIICAHPASAQTSLGERKTDNRSSRHRLSPAHRSVEQQILPLEEYETLAPLIAGFRQSLLDIDALPARQRAVAQRWNCHTLAEESEFMARSLRDFTRACEARNGCAQTDTSSVSARVLIQPALVRSSEE